MTFSSHAMVTADPALSPAERNELHRKIEAIRGVLAVEFNEKTGAFGVDYLNVNFMGVIVENIEKDIRKLDGVTNFSPPATTRHGRKLDGK
jgi:hypothetical protein